MRAQVEDTTSDYDARTAGAAREARRRVAIIKVGAPPNRDEGEEARVEDAMHATKRRGGGDRPRGAWR